MHAKDVEIVVRPMQDRDLQQAVQIEREAFGEDAPDEVLLFYYKTHLDEMDQFAAVAELDGKLVGSILYVRRESQIYIDSLAVRAEDRRQGAGEAMLRYLLCQMPFLNMKEMLLHVKEGNPAQKLYEKIGFVVVEIADWQYADGSKAIKMVFAPGEHDVFVGTSSYLRGHLLRSGPTASP